MFPCHFASTSHRIFAFRLELLVDGDEFADCDPATVANPGACELGKWLVAHAVELAHLPHFRELEATHRRFHQIAGEMIGLVRRGEEAEARQLHATRFRAASDAVLAAIAAMADEIRRWPQLDGIGAPH